VVPSLILFLSIGGCGGKNYSPPAPTDAAQGREALKTALDAWKSGATPDSLRSASPAMHVADEDWQGGYRLETYQIGERGKATGTSYQCPVTLTLRDPQGGSVTRQATYAVATDPAVSVVRMDNDS
jgi:hypothetical protein